MRYSIISKEFLLNVLGETETLDSKLIKLNELENVSQKIMRDEILLVWNGNSVFNDSPVWFIRDDKYEEMIAYLSTYVRSYTPFSAFNRILPLKFLNLINKIKGKKSKESYNKLICIVIAESLYQYDSSINSISDISVQASLATVSSSIVSALFLGYGAKDIATLIENWTSVRTILKSPTPPLNSEILAKFWMLICSVISDMKPTSNNVSSKMNKAIKRIIKQEEIKVGEWGDLTYPNKDIGEYFLSLKGPREESIEEFNNLLNLIEKKTEINESDKQIILGAALSIVSSGSLSLLPWTMRFKQRFPLFPLWYSFFCGFNKHSDVKEIADGLGNHLAKRILCDQRLFDSPTSDISFPEFKVIYRGNNILPNFRSAQSSVLDIEIIPLVNCKFSKKKFIQSNKVQNQNTLTEDEIFKMQGFLESALKILKKEHKQNSQYSLFDEDKNQLQKDQTVKKNRHKKYR